MMVLTTEKKNQTTTNMQNGNKEQTREKTKLRKNKDLRGSIYIGC